jgi:hypothetical protein
MAEARGSDVRNPDEPEEDSSRGHRRIRVVVQLECATNVQVEKDSSLPLGMTTN